MDECERARFDKNVIKDEMKWLVNIVKTRVPESREASLTITKLEEALMWFERVKDEVK